MDSRRRIALFVPAVLVGALLMPAAAFGQASRTWVAGTGDDTFPCSRTAPCRTLVEAHNKVASGGEINVIDSCGCGGLTITKSVTIRANRLTVGVLASGTNGITVNAGATGKVVIDGLDINGGAGATTGLTGIKVLSAKQVIVRNTEIYRFRAGVAIMPTSAQTRVVLTNNLLNDNGVGVLNAPGNGGVLFTTLTMRANEVVDNLCGVAVSAFGANSATPDATTDCGTAAPGGPINKTAHATLVNNAIHDNGFGVFSRGSLAMAEILRNTISGNFNFALRRLDAGGIRTFTPNTNVISNNAASDGPSATSTLTR